ncbi:hypothetical protein [Telluribacter sp. SYSU D00476]|uniref:hypothetical protein n=1 Tax=Telluribacter sp. SYSU D00476 TaxID=2811430 RepID=UPI001FF39388|nr:hypothetical protein [Telluribacter sp. SYSU D00476]
MENNSDQLFNRLKSVADARGLEDKRKAFLQEKGFQYKLFDNLFKFLKERIEGLKASGINFKIDYFTFKGRFRNIDGDYRKWNDTICITSEAFKVEIELILKAYNKEEEHGGITVEYLHKENLIEIRYYTFELDVYYNISDKTKETMGFSEDLQLYYSLEQEEILTVDVDKDLNPKWGEETNATLTNSILTWFVEKIEREM